MCRGGKKMDSGLDFVIFLEREHILSRIPANRIVGSRRSKKESFSKW